MSNDLSSVAEVFENKTKQDEEIINNVSDRLKTGFPDPAQYEVLFEIYKQVFRISGDVQELNINSMFLSSFIESFQEHLVGEGKLIPEEVYLETAHKIFQTTLDEVTQAYKETTNQTEKSD